MGHKKLGEENIVKLFFSYSIPAIISMVIAGAQTIIDGIFLGRFANINAMSGVNIVQPFLQLIFALSFVVCIGAMSKIGRSLGENNIKTAQSVFRTSSLFVTICSFILVIIAILFNKQIARLLGASNALINEGSDYLLYFTCFTPIIANMFLFGFTDRIIGKPNQYLFATIISVLVNISLNYLFIVKLNMNAKGAAIASGLAYLSSLIVCLIPLFNKKHTINLFEGKINFKLMLSVCANGFSEAVTSLSTALTIYLFNSALIQVAGDEGVGAFTIINYIGTFSTIFMFGVSDGISPIISYNYGYNKIHRVKKILILAFIFNLIAGVLIFCFIFFFAHRIIMLFNNNNSISETVVDLATNGAKLYSISFIIIGFNLVASGFFTAIGNALYSIIIAISRGALWIIVGIKLLPLCLGINGIWLTAPFAEIITFITSLIMFSLINSRIKKKLNILV